jgi:arylsulfatase A-like enzyme/Flp pilus assembly protein TadD
MNARGLVLVSLGAVALACGGERPASLLLVSFDTTRADRIGAYGHAAAETPNLDRLAREGVLFEQALAPAPITLPTHASLLTGVYPTAHGVRDNGSFALGDSAALVSEVLAARGWQTGAFVGSYVLDARFGLGQGFARYDGPQLRADASAVGAARTADEVADAAIAWLGELDPSQPFFAFVHFYDPHEPYRPPQPFAARHAHPYDGEIAFADAQLGRLLGALAESGRDRDLVVVVTADHGEALGEHGEDTHGIFVYQATLRVPLVVGGAGLRGAERGVRIAEPVSLTRVAATLLAQAGIEAEALPRAASPLPLANATSNAAPVYFETHLPFHNMRWHALRGLLAGRHKLVQGRTAELFDLTNDPGEARDLATAQPEDVAALRERLAAFEREHADLGWGLRREPGADEAAQLAALGYAEGAQAGDPLDPALPDPRERIEEYRRYQRADEAWNRSRRLERHARTLEGDARARAEASLRAAREQALALLAQDEAGDNPMTLELVGKLALAQGDAARAASALERAVRLQAGVATSHYNLGLAYRKLGRRDDARRAFESAYELEPRQPRFVLLVAEQLADGPDPELARPWIERARPLVAADGPYAPKLAALEEKLGRER